MHHPKLKKPETNQTNKIKNNVFVYDNLYIFYSFLANIRMRYCIIVLVYFKSLCVSNHYKINTSFTL